jgi:hypothetical protein
MLRGDELISLTGGVRGKERKVLVKGWFHACVNGIESFFWSAMVVI